MCMHRLTTRQMFRLSGCGKYGTRLVWDVSRQEATTYHDTIAPMFEVIRRQIDKLELIVDDALWPLPKYRELLFIR